MAKILLIEDKVDEADAIKSWLERENHQVEWACDGDQASFMLSTYSFDVILLDWDLPKLSGIEILRQYRNSGGKARLIMLTGKSDIDSKQLGLDSGADDYLTKPFQPRELSSRIRAVQRRSLNLENNVLKCGPISYDLTRTKVFKDDEEILLMPLEYALLEFLMRHRNQVFSADALLNHVWNSESEATGVAVRSAVSRLRKKLHIDGHRPVIVTLAGLGYRLECED